MVYMKTKNLKNLIEDYCIFEDLNIQEEKDNLIVIDKHEEFYMNINKKKNKMKIKDEIISYTKVVQFNSMDELKTDMLQKELNKHKNFLMKNFKNQL